MSIGRVFITQETKHDFEPAATYGELVFITKGDLHNSKGSLHNAALTAEITDTLISFDPDIDWIVIAGSPYVAAAVFLELGARGLTSVRILRWQNRDFCYTPLYLDI